jgi:glycosyltransferase 2 family protein
VAYIKRKTVVSTSIRFAVSAALIFWLLHRVRLEELSTALRGSQWWLFALSTLILCGRQIIATCRWAIILAASRIRVPLAWLLYWYMTATFFNLFLPTALGGDVMRIYQLAKNTGRNAAAAASVLMERILGFLALIGMAVVAMLLSTKARQEPTIYLGVLVAAGALVAVLVALFHRGFGRMTVRLFRRVGLQRLGEKAERGYAALYTLQQHRKTIFLAFLISVVFQAVGVVCTYLVGLSLGLNVSVGYYFISIPIIWLLTMLPISINGIGVREGGFVLFFTAVGVSTPDALLLSFLTFAQLLIIGLLGGVVYAIYPWLSRSSKKAAVE